LCALIVGTMQITQSNGLLKLLRWCGKPYVVAMCVCVCVCVRVVVRLRACSSSQQVCVAVTFKTCIRNIAGVRISSANRLFWHIFIYFLNSLNYGVFVYALCYQYLRLYSHWMIVIAEMEAMWRDAVVACCKVLFPHLRLDRRKSR